jgi:parallel beta-helix repeat protein
MRSKLGLAAVVCVAAAMLLSPTVAAAMLLAPTSSDSSGTLVITSNTLLTEDHEGSIVVARNGVTLDCAGHTLTGAGPGSGPGLELSGRRNVAIKNCRVTNFDSGFLVVDTTGSTFMNNIAESNHLSGFDLYESSGNSLAGNRADGNLVHGVSAVGGRNNTVKENSASGNAHVGFDFILSTNNTVKENVSTDNVENGFDFPASSGNDVRGNISRGNVSLWARPQQLRARQRAHKHRRQLQRRVRHRALRCTEQPDHRRHGAVERSL